MSGFSCIPELRALVRKNEQHMGGHEYRELWSRIFDVVEEAIEWNGTHGDVAKVASLEDAVTALEEEMAS